MDGAPSYDKSCWTDIKDNLGLDFPNLPYFLDGNIKITQSNAILRHIARKNGLCGESVEEKAECAMDLRNTIVRLVYNPDYVMMNNLNTYNHILFFSIGQPVAPIY